jgi:hypothetical protein
LVNLIKDNLATPDRIAEVMKAKATDLVSGTRR